MGFRDTDSYNSNDTLPRGVSSDILSFGTYAVFTLNPAATLEALRDPLATEQARLSPKRRYVGMVTHCDIVGFTSREFYSCQLALLSQGLPRPSPSQGIEETMCVPISPATHPAGRAGVSPTPPLPWDNLYHHTTLSFNVRLLGHPGGPVDDSKSPMLSLNKLMEVVSPSGKDKLRRRELTQAHEATHSRQATEPAGMSPAPVNLDASMTTSPFEDRPDGHPEDFDEDDDLEEELTFGEGASHAPAYSEFSEHESDAGRELDAVMLEFMTQGLGHKGDPAAEFIPFVDFDLDLSTVTEFTDAEGLAEEIEALERIWKQSQERNWEYMNGKREQIMRHRELAREQRRRKEEEEDNMKTRPEESSPIALQKRCTHRIARVPKVLRGAGKRLRNVARKLLVKAGHPTSHSSWRSPKSKIEGEAAIIPAKVKSGMTNRKASDCILDALTSCVRWSQPDESEVGMEKP